MQGRALFDLNPGQESGEASGKVPLALSTRLLTRTIFTNRESSSLALKPIRMQFCLLPVTDVARCVECKQKTYNKTNIPNNAWVSPCQISRLETSYAIKASPKRSFRATRERLRRRRKPKSRSASLLCVPSGLRGRNGGGAFGFRLGFRIVRKTRKCSLCVLIRFADLDWGFCSRIKICWSWGCCSRVNNPPARRCPTLVRCVVGPYWGWTCPQVEV